MATNTITVKGYIKDGHLQVELPQNVADGEVEVTIAVREAETPLEEQPWTDEEIENMIHPEPKSGAEIVARLRREGGWEDYGITDGAEWVQEQRRKRRERRGW